MADDNGKEQRVPSQKRRRNLAVSALRSTTDGEQGETNNESTEIPLSSEENLDAELTDEDTIFAHEQTFSDLSVKENIQTQKEDVFFAGIINYLRTAHLPKNKDDAPRIAIQAGNFYIEYDQLYHIAVMRGKRLNLIRPAFAQLCTPKRYRMEALER
jgi:hypothetical protein